MIDFSSGLLADDNEALLARGDGGRGFSEGGGNEVVIDLVEGGVGRLKVGGVLLPLGGRLMSGERKGFFRVELAESRRRLGGGGAGVPGGSAMATMW